MSKIEELIGACVLAYLLYLGVYTYLSRKKPKPTEENKE